MSGSGACAGSTARQRLRPVVSDDGREIMLTVYDADRLLVAEVALSPLHCIAVAGELIDAAGRHLQRATNGAVAARRGRGQRTSKTVVGLLKGNEALVALREQFFGDLGITRAGDEIAAEGRQYETTGWRFDQRKQPAEIDNDRRRLFAEVLRGRRHFPGSRQVRGVLSEMNSAPIHFLNSRALGSDEDLDN